MPFPLIPFVAGAVIGGIASRLYSDEKIRSNISQATNSASDKIQVSASRVTNTMATGVTTLKGRILENVMRTKGADAKDVTPKAKRPAKKKTTARRKTSAKKKVTTENLEA